MEVFIGWVIASLAIGIIGRNKECGFFKSFLCCIFITPIIGSIYVICSKHKLTISEELDRAKVLYENGVISDLIYEKAKEDIINGKKINENRYINMSEKELLKEVVAKIEKNRKKI